MSNPPNPLAKFRTYSYHHVLFVCATTAAAEAIASNDGFDSFVGVQRREADGSPKIHSGGGGKYVVLLDGRSSADFVIESVEWELITVPEFGQQSTKGATSMDVQGTMTIIEPRGVDFLTTIALISDALKTDYSSLIYVLKTYFVGYSSDAPNGNNISEHISNVRPMMFLFLNIAATFDHSGSEYRIEMLGLTNGAGKLPQVAKSADQVSMAVQPGQTVGQALDKLAALMTCLAKEAYDKVQEAGTQAGIPLPVGKKVEYKIFYDDIYGTSDYKIDTTAPTTQSKGQGQEDTIITFGQTATVESAIDIIMQKSQKVAKDATGEGRNDIGGNKKFIWKVHTTRETTDRIHKEIWRVSQYELPVVLAQNATTGSANSLLGSGNFIEFDYFFTGKNIDILEFDMRADNAMMFLQSVTSANAIALTKDDAKTQPGQTATVHRGYIATSPESRIKDNAPVYPFTKMDDIMYSNATNTKRRIKLAEQFNAYAGFESIEAKLKIIGNIALLDNTASLPSEVAQGRPAATTVGQSIAKNWQARPTLVKINVLMPQDSNAANTGPFKEFWFQGFYYILAIVNTFESGEFTQTLDMLSVITESPIALTSALQDVRSQDVPGHDVDKADALAHTKKPPVTSICAEGNAGGGNDADKKTAESVLRATT
jgi:hypothetical protein